MQFTALLHHVTPQLLTQSFYSLRRDAAVGVDGMSWREYEEGLLRRVTDLHARLNSGAYRATPSRRVYIPKADGRQRPLGIASLEDKMMLMFLGHRIADRRLLGLICKWLQEGIMEEGRRVAAAKGTPQGAVISPLLANIYLHYVLDLWARQWRERHARGDVIVVRYADDSVVGFRLKSQAQQFLQQFRERLARFGLSLNASKTRLIEFVVLLR